MKSIHHHVSVIKRYLSGLMVILCMATATTANALIVDATPLYPPVTFFASGTMPADATLRIEILTTLTPGGTPVLPGTQFDIAVPAGAVDVWGPVVLGAIDADSSVVSSGVITTSTISGKTFLSMPISSLTGYRIAFRAISTTTALLPAIPSMPALAASAIPWPVGPMQLVPAGGDNFDTSAPATAEATSIMGTHYLAVPPFLAGNSPDDPFIGFTTTPTPVNVTSGNVKPVIVPTLGQWGQILLFLLLSISAIILIRKYKH